MSEGFDLLIWFPFDLMEEYDDLLLECLREDPDNPEEAVKFFRDVIEDMLECREYEAEESA